MGHGMKLALFAWIALMGAATSALAQLPAVKVYSEFQRIDPSGKVISADQPRRAGIAPREILSPALARNAHAAFHLTVTVPAGTDFSVYVGQNPEGYLGVAVYKEIYQKRGAEWVPDDLEPVTLPYAGRLPDAGRPIPDQSSQSFLVDLWVPPDAEVRRTKVEPEVWVDGQWIVYPMEVRIVAATVPEHKDTGVPLAAVDQPSDSAARAALRSYLCGGPAGGSAARAGIRWILLRDALQDIALARWLESAPGARLLPELLKLAGAGDAAEWCQAPVFPEDVGPEWYLRLRDSLYRMAE
jgi:hypothetical protein